MLELKNIIKKYTVADNSVTVLKGINLVFRKAEFVSILGQSGCGKTTLLNIIGGLDRFDSGDLIINGNSTKNYSSRDWDTYRNHSIGFVFQSYNLIPHQTILQNVELALSIGGVSKSIRKEMAKKALERVGLGDHINKKPNQLSGGQCQRVSIARALVNNPDIILADEPTGALDSETSVQVMEILKEISKDRLVIMVTHNPDLAEKYSTRIIKMLDGEIKDDSNKVSEEEYGEIKKQVLKDAKKSLSTETGKKKKRKEQSAMSYGTSILLSLKNLLTKKKRTFITSLACSIGIIGIAVILSVSAGMKGYIDSMQLNSASVNYISISSSSINLLDMMMPSTDKSDLEEYPDNTTGIQPYEPKEIPTSTQILSEDYIAYLENMDSDWILDIQYSRDTALNIVATDGVNYNLVDTDNWTEIIDNPDYISTQFTTLYKGEDNKSLPTAFNEVVLVVDKYNRLSTKILDNLGINYEDDLSEISYADIVDKEFKLVLNDDYYTQSTAGERVVFTKANTQGELENCYNNGISLKIVSVIRQNSDEAGLWIDDGIGYTTALTEYVLEQNANSQVVQAQANNSEYDILTGADFGGNPLFPFLPSTTYAGNMVKLGADSTPESIKIFPADFESKDYVVEYLDLWNSSEIYKLYGNAKDSEGNYEADQYKVEYTDVSKLMSDMLTSTVDIITYALIAFSAVSLVVSSIMIAIITYASVIERIKEIGVLRSLGARKKDISRVFIAEACIIGLVSAVIALIATIILDLIINIVVGSLVGVYTIAKLDFITAFSMVLLCVGLNLIASLIPANIASKKDPVVALRSE